ncbi:coat protein [ssRNA phage SRR6960551_4]|uniref:Coat protein n=1 Tax=ssRNA phage SRR6960551_4 TaxID=2786555 RepID=A0A8S5L4H0_9VIRU|nr:coat protein [ssRNA phage SRR6960551_4]DAD52606.1 TPA_asm: coat protein [ssRNA phage SRR6960551_4]
MPAISNITLTDGTTPITFAHSSHDANNLLMIDNAGSTSESSPRLLLSRFNGKRGSPNRKYRVKLTFAYLETVSGSLDGYVAPPKIAYTNIAQADFTFNKRASSPQCQSAKSYLMSSLGNNSTDFTVVANPLIHNAIINDQFPY